MKRMLLTSVTVAVILISVSLANIGGCKAGSSCDLNFIVVFVNGSSSDMQDSEWECENGGVLVFTIAFFRDGTGFRSDAGEFTWEQTGCYAVDFETVSLESGSFVNIQGYVATTGSTTFGNLSMEQQSDDLGDIQVACTYNQF